MSSPSATASLFQTLSDEPVLGQSLVKVTVLRLDQLGGIASGNKRFKLQPYLQRASDSGLHRILSFGGAWSNHLHALAAAGAEQGFETVGFVRGGEVETPTLADARRWGMRLVPLSRSDYRRRQEEDFQRTLLERHGPGLLIPEGGGDREGVLGCLDIAELINSADTDWSLVAVPVGTGTTLAGLVAGLASGTRVLGVSALRNAKDLEGRVIEVLESAGRRAAVPWQIEHAFHCGGFARVTPELQRFILDFEARHGLLLEPVYTGKMFLAVHQLLAEGRIDTTKPILLVHTGGLQGRRGYPWLAAA